MKLNLSYNFVLTLILAGTMLTSCANENKKTNPTTQEETTEIVKEEEINEEEVIIDSETLAFLDEYEKESIAQMEKELAETEKELAKVIKIGQNLKAKNKKQIKEIETLFNDSLINEETLNKNAELRKSFCDLYQVYEENITELGLTKSKRAKELKPLYEKMKKNKH